MTNREERTVLLNTLVILKEQQETANSKTLGLLIKYAERWLKKLYRDATKKPTIT